MGLFFKKKAGSKAELPKAVAFVDYEHWYISLERTHGKKPDIQSWFDDLKKRCNIIEVIFFANFQKFKDKETETKRIRAFTNKIIDTYNPDQRYKKDYTDFIILDNIYQKAFQSDSADLFIIFSGDGHFSSCAAFLKNFCGKQVGIYGVSGGISKNLVNSSDWCIEMPLKVDEGAVYRNALFSYLKECESIPDFFPTYKRSVEFIAKQTELEQETLEKTLSDLIKQNYILQESSKTSSGRSIRYLKPDWNTIAKDGIWESLD